MGRYVDDERWVAGLDDYKRTNSIKGAAGRAGIDYSSFRMLLKGTPQEQRRSSGFRAYQKWLGDNPPDVLPRDKMSAEALQGLEDIAFFALWHFGMVLRPWALDCVAELVELAKTPHKEYMLVNAPPGIAKSSTLSWVYPCWEIARDREITIFFGSASQTLADWHLKRVRDTLERTVPITYSDVYRKRWGSVDAKATLIDSYGRFKPANSRQWTASSFTVATLDDVPGSAKEPTMSAWGPGSAFVGGRFERVIWDDLVNKNSSGTEGGRANVVEVWQGEGETRLNDAGVLLLQGQRLFNDDLYSTIAKETRPVDLDDETEAAMGDFDEIPEVPAYKHLVYQAHDDTNCKGREMHLRSAPPMDPRDRDNTSCLIDPYILPWRELQRIRTRGEARYQLTYQQNDAVVENRLVDPEWINGSSGFRGCLDTDRSMGDYPQALSKPWINYITVDPSGEKYWALTNVIYHPATEQRFVVWHVRKQMNAGDFLDFNPTNNVWSGLAETWVHAGGRAGYPVDYIVMEQNAVQRWFFRFDWSKQWMASRRVKVIGHETGRNKTDPDLGITSLLPPQFEHGRYRIPAKRADGTWLSVKQWIYELTHWPETKTEDTVLNTWFGEYQLPQMVKGKLRSERPITPVHSTPGWVRDIQIPDFVSQF